MKNGNAVIIGSIAVLLVVCIGFAIMAAVRSRQSEVPVPTAAQIRTGQERMKQFNRVGRMSDIINSHGHPTYEEMQQQQH